MGLFYPNLLVPEVFPQPPRTWSESRVNPSSIRFFFGLVLDRKDTDFQRLRIGLGSKTTRICWRRHGTWTMQVVVVTIWDN